MNNCLREIELILNFRSLSLAPMERYCPNMHDVTIFCFGLLRLVRLRDPCCLVSLKQYRGGLSPTPQIEGM